MTATRETIGEIRATRDRLLAEMARVVVGHETLIEQLFVCLLCGGHALIEGVPGLGKTLVVKSFGRVLGLSTTRIQFTPDLMPADILGTNLVKEDADGRRRFEFYKGPIFGQIVLADEINRASPKTQSALLEAMQEQRVTVFGTPHTLPSPFMVLATQNPIEMEGTYPLPEAQVDRFLFKLLVPYPDRAQLHEIIVKTTERIPPEPAPVLEPAAIAPMRDVVRQVPIAGHVREFAIRAVTASHPSDPSAPETTRRYVRFGASPRGLQGLVLAAKATALLAGRFNVSVDDVRAVATPSLRHRIGLNIRGEAEGVAVDTLVDEILQRAPARRGPFEGGAGDR